MKKFGDAQDSAYCCSCKIHIRRKPINVVNDGFIGSISLLTSILGVYAYCQRAAWAWLPITVWNGCWAANHLLCAVINLILHVVSYFDFQAAQDLMGLKSGQINPQVYQIVSAVAAVVLVLLTWLWAWFTMITYSAYKWQKREDSQNTNNNVKVDV
ncbi:hypothetical protein AAVH_31976 [Aphelenchoides avenae]|nr:hypothetical protein AAVH_31976 [Aphelenchus avenae]